MADSAARKLESAAQYRRQFYALNAMKTYQILLIDQDPDEMLLMQAALEEMNLLVKCLYYSDAREAIQFIASTPENQLDLILFSMSFAGRREEWLVSELIAAMRHGQSRVAVYALDPEPLSSFLAAHKCHFVAKGVSIEEIRHALSEALQG